MKRLLGFLLSFLFAGASLAQTTLTPNISLQVPAYQQTNWQVPLNFDLNLLDSILGGVQTLPAGTATPAVNVFGTFVTANTSSITLTNFTGGFPGQTIRLVCGASDTFTSVANSAFINVFSTWSCSSSFSLTLVNISGVWTETARRISAPPTVFYQTVQNASGTAVTQRPTIEFTGTAVASVVDDSGNNRTVVTLTANAGSGVTLQTNGTNNTSQTALNLQNSAATNGLTLTFTNGSAGNVQLGLTGTLNDAGLTAAYSGVGTCASSPQQFVISASRNASPGCAQPAFSGISGTVALGSQVSGTLSGSNMSAVNLAGTGNGGITGNLPVANIAAGTNGQCIETSGTTSMWGSCTGTLGVQTLTVNSAGSIANSSTTNFQTLYSYTFAAGQLNTVGKSFRVTHAGSFTLLNTSQNIIFALGNNGTSGPTAGLIPTGLTGGFYSVTWTCTVRTAGSSGFIFCGGQTGIQGVSSSSTSFAPVSNGTLISVNLTASFTLSVMVDFGVTASTSNTATDSIFTLEQLN